MQDEKTQKKRPVKRYFWLKLKEEFFQDKEIKKLRRIAGGDTYTIIYLKLMLLSLKSDGRLYFDGIEDSFYEELALEIDEDPENVKVTLMYLEKMSLVKLVNEDEMFLTQMDNLIVSESESAKRVRAHRARKKLLEGSNGQLELPLSQGAAGFEDDFDSDETLHGNADVTECNADETNCNTYTDTETNTDKETQAEETALVEEMFLRVWSMYPFKKAGKRQVRLATRKRLYSDIGEEQLIRCIERFKEDMSSRDPRYVMQASTFFNSGYEDYLDLNYRETMNITNWDAKPANGQLKRELQ